jgi:hypothetical protein
LTGSANWTDNRPKKKAEATTGPKSGSKIHADSTQEQQRQRIRRLRDEPSQRRDKAGGGTTNQAGDPRNQASDTWIDCQTPDRSGSLQRQWR